MSAPSGSTALRSPDGNSVNIQFIRPTGGKSLTCVYYKFIGGGMATMSCYYGGNYRAWGRMIAAKGVAVAMVDFRNAVRASTAPEVAPYPAGLNDCVSGLKWVHANADKLGIDTGRVIVAGESGGGNLTLATGMKLLREGDIGLVRGLYALCPYIAGEWPLPESPSSSDNEGILISVHHNRGAMGYGIAAFRARDPLAWPSFAKGQGLFNAQRSTREAEVKDCIEAAEANAMPGVRDVMNIVKPAGYWRRREREQQIR